MGWFELLILYGQIKLCWACVFGTELASLKQTHIGAVVILLSNFVVPNFFRNLSAREEAHCYALQDEFIADQLFQNSEHTADDLISIISSILSSGKVFSSMFLSCTSMDLSLYLCSLTAKCIIFVSFKICPQILNLGHSFLLYLFYFPFQLFAVLGVIFIFYVLVFVPNGNVCQRYVAYDIFQHFAGSDCAICFFYFLTQASSSWGLP